MTTIINTPRENDGSGGTVGLVLGIVVAIVIVGAFAFYAFPALRGNLEQADPTTEIKINIPTPTTGEAAKTE